MLITTNARKQLRKVIFWIAVVVFLISLMTERLLQARIDATTAKTEIANHWLQGDITELPDPEIQAIWANIRSRFTSLAERFIYPKSSSVKAPIVLTDNFSDEHRRADNTASKWPTKKGSNLEINYGFGTFILNPPSPLPKETVDDRERYEKFVYDLSERFKGPQIKGLTSNGFSDEMMNYFGIKDLMQKRLPNVTITLAYATTDKGTTLVMYPGTDITFQGEPFTERDWYKSAFHPEKISPEYIHGDQNFGLARFYADYATKEYTRTIWYKVLASNGTTYLLCMDMTLVGQEQQATGGLIDKIPFIGSYSGPGKGWLRTITVGIIWGGAFLGLGLMLTHLGGYRSTKLARWVISGGSLPKQTESGDQFIPIFRAFAERGATIVTNDEYGTSETKKVSFTAWLQMKVTKIEVDQVKAIWKDNHVAMTQVVELGTLDRDPYTRGLEKWHIFRDKGSEVGNCRLCGQEVRYKDKEEPIAQVTIKHGKDPRPIVKLDIDTRSHIKEIRSLEERVVWQAFDEQSPEVKTVQELAVIPSPRVPDKIQKMRFARDLIDRYRLLNEGRYEVDDCIEISKELFNGRNVRAFCKVAYFEKLSKLGRESLRVLRMGDNVTRIFITDTKEAKSSFVKENQETLRELLAQRNQQLSVVSLDDLQIDKIKAYPELDFAIVYDGDFRCVVVSSLSEINKAAKIRGYVSWREADIAFYETLFQSLKGSDPLNEDVLSSFSD